MALPRLPALLILLPLAAPLQARPEEPIPPAPDALHLAALHLAALHLADCAGRLMALRDHQWLLNQPDAAATETLRLTLLAELAPLTTPETARALLARRIEARAAQAALLSRATFARPSDTTRRAAQLSARHLRPCRALPRP